MYLLTHASHTVQYVHIVRFGDGLPSQQSPLSLSRAHASVSSLFSPLLFTVSTVRPAFPPLHLTRPLPLPLSHGALYQVEYWKVLIGAAVGAIVARLSTTDGIGMAHLIWQAPVGK